MEILGSIAYNAVDIKQCIEVLHKKSTPVEKREFDSCLQFFTNQIAQNVDYINAFEFFYCQIREIISSNM